MCNERNEKSLDVQRKFKVEILNDWINCEYEIHKYDKSFKYLDDIYTLIKADKCLLKELAEEYGYTEEEFKNNNYELYKKYFNEFLKEFWYKIEKNRPLLKLVKLNKVNCSSFSEIGYFGKINWNEAKEFADSNSEGWRLPDIGEADEMELRGGIMKELCGENSFHFWTKYKSYMKHITGGFYDAGTEYHYDACVFYVR